MKLTKEKLKRTIKEALSESYEPPPVDWGEVAGKIGNQEEEIISRLAQEIIDNDAHPDDMAEILDEEFGVTHDNTMDYYIRKAELRAQKIKPKERSFMQKAGSFLTGGGFKESLNLSTNELRKMILEEITTMIKQRKKNG